MHCVERAMLCSAAPAWPFGRIFLELLFNLIYFFPLLLKPLLFNLKSSLGIYCLGSLFKQNRKRICRLTNA